MIVQLKETSLMVFLGWTITSKQSRFARHEVAMATSTSMTRAALGGEETLRHDTPLPRNKNGKKRFEVLSRAVEMDERGHALDPRFALLRSPLAEKMEHEKYNWFSLAISTVLAAWIMTKTTIWRIGFAIYCLLADREELRHVRANKSIRFLMGPKHGSLWFDQMHPLNDEVRHGVTTSKALDAIYSMPLLMAGDHSIRGRFVKFWLSEPDGQGVRNRLIITFHNILGELRRRWDAGQHDFLLLSLACGSAQAMVEAVSVFLGENPSAGIRLDLVDMNEASLRRAYRLAEARGISGCVAMYVARLQEFLADAEERYDVVEMVGFLDYRTSKSVVLLTAAVRQVLKDGSLHLSAHILPCRWQFVTRWVIGWPLLIRRSVPTYNNLLLDSGFRQSEIEMVVEPHRAYAVALCRKA